MIEYQKNNELMNLLWLYFEVAQTNNLKQDDLLYIGSNHSTF